MIKSFTGANFTGTLHQRLRFQTLNTQGAASGEILTGEVQRIYRSAGSLCVDIYLPSTRCIHTYFARNLYYKGAGWERRPKA